MSKHDLRSSTLMGSKLLGDGEQDPMGSMGNLMDVMLVFACGLLLALIANWNVDLTDVQSSSGGSSAIKEIEGDLEEVEEGIATDSNSYEEMGTVYRDGETGQLYVVSPEGQE